MALLCAQVGEFDASARGTLVHQHRSTISQRSFVQSGKSLMVNQGRQLSKE